MTSPFPGERLGTRVMTNLGHGVGAGALLRGSKAEVAGWIAITAGWAFALLAGIFVATATGGPNVHINPAVTIAAAITPGSVSKLFVYVPAQTISAFLRAIVVWPHDLPPWAITEDPETKRACFRTDPAIQNTSANWMSEIIGTVLLILIIRALLSRTVGAAGTIPTGLAPDRVGMVVWGIGLSLGGATGDAINPARHLGPRRVQAVLPISGKGDSDWGYALSPLAGPAVGAALAARLILATGF